MKILKTESTQETHKTTPNKTNTSSNRPRTQQPQQSQQPQRSYRPRTNQPEDREKDYIYEELKINNIVSHIIGREGRNIRYITSKHNTKAHYDTNTEMMTITGTKRRDLHKTIEDITEIIEARTQDQETTRPTPRNPTYQPRPTQHEPQHNRPRQEEERYTYSRRAELRELREPPYQHTQQRYRDRSPHHQQEFKHPRNN